MGIVEGYWVIWVLGDLGIGVLGYEFDHLTSSNKSEKVHLSLDFSR
jgi:hypothetical protein